MLRTLISKIAGDPMERTLRHYRPIVDAVAGYENDYAALSDTELAELTATFRERYDDGESLDDLLPEAFAAVREAAKRTIGLRPYDVQIIGGAVLHQGQVAEMKTGEGKTLVATLPLYLNALTRQGVHLVTPNDYLSKVGVQWMGPVYHALGMTAGVIQNQGANPQMASFVYDPDFQADDDRYQHLRPVPRQEAYRSDILYGTNNEFGFDYLRDNMVWDLADRVQRDLYFAIVDEVDNILIDEARTPLIISGQAEEATDWYVKFAELVRRLRRDVDYTLDEKLRSVTATDDGIERIENWLGVDNLYSPEHYELTPYFENALKAQAIFHRDKEYIVSEEGEVIIVDEFTGRLMHGRRFSEGLHQAIEAKEGVHVQRESVTLATITFQNYFRMYDKLAGMTGTAATEAEELDKIYKLEVSTIPTHRKVVRLDQADYVYKGQDGKWRAVVEEIANRHEAGQPVLVGTVNVDTSESLSKKLTRRGIKHEVLNAKNHEREAEIIAQAGRVGAVTIATNMAGRGVDILLGGNAEGYARAELRRMQFDLTTLPTEAWEEAVNMLRAGEDPTAKFPDDWAKVLAKAWRTTQSDKAKVLELGGLFVLGTERHEARRIDNQLRGRSGRQGDPGESRFYVALDDELMIRFGGERVKALMDRFGLEEDQEIESNLITRQIEGAQVKVEGFNFDIRKHLLEYDEVINEQRKVIYEQRTEILKRGPGELRPIIWEMIDNEITGMVDTATASDDRDDWDMHGLEMMAQTIVPPVEGEDPEDWRAWGHEDIAGHLLAMAEDAYNDREARYGVEGMYDREKAVLLRAIDTAWIHHLTEIDDLRQGIGLRAVAQQDPLVTFKREAYGMFQSLLGVIQATVARAIFADRDVAVARPRSMDRIRVGRGELLAQAQAASAAQAPAAEPVRAGPRTGRNDPCWCGSGKKYKHCHMRTDGVG